MTVTGVDFKDGSLMIRTMSPDALKFAKAFKEEGEYEITKTVKKRSINANSFAWELIGKLSQAMLIDKETVYCDAIRHIGAFNPIAIYGKNAAEDFKRIWDGQGLGDCAEIVDISSGWYYINAHYGSSKYDSKQMSVFIDYLKQDCESIGIVVDDERITSLIEEWERDHG